MGEEDVSKMKGKIQNKLQWLASEKGREGRLIYTNPQVPTSLIEFNQFNRVHGPVPKQKRGS